MSEFYRLQSFDPSPLTLDMMKEFLKIENTDSDDLLTSMIEAATSWAEKYTARDFRAKTWELYLDCFSARIEVKRDPVESIDSVEHIVNDVFETVDASIYYLKSLTQKSEILLKSGEDWPSDTDEREQAILVTFTTAGYDCPDLIINALQRLVAYMFANRGDCTTAGGGSCSCSDSIASGAGVLGTFDLITIARV